MYASWFPLAVASHMTVVDNPSKHGLHQAFSDMLVFVGT